MAFRYLDVSTGNTARVSKWKKETITSTGSESLEFFFHLVPCSFKTLLHKLRPNRPQSGPTFPFPTPRTRLFLHASLVNKLDHYSSGLRLPGLKSDLWLCLVDIYPSRLSPPLRHPSCLAFILFSPCTPCPSSRFSLIYTSPNSPSRPNWDCLNKSFGAFRYIPYKNQPTSTSSLRKAFQISYSFSFPKSGYIHIHSSA